MDKKTISLYLRALKNVLQKDRETISLIARLASLIGVEFLVLDVNERVLWGEVDKKYK